MQNCPFPSTRRSVSALGHCAAQFPGAESQTIAETVATPIEEQINGVEGMLYMDIECDIGWPDDATVTSKLGT